jgi:hypothetical protein
VTNFPEFTRYFLLLANGFANPPTVLFITPPSAAGFTGRGVGSELGLCDRGALGRAPPFRMT